MEASERKPQAAEPAPSDLIGSSAAMAEVTRLIETAGESTITVMLTGESGTGKTLAARHIHARSARSARPFLQLNCASLTESLLESELFGHERGAFTGADRRHAGKFEQANGGTLFLDEIEELSPRAQAKLLNVIEGGKLTRVGGEEEVRTDVRLIVATNCDLRELVAGGRFRGDLFYRLSELSIHMPPLRERRQDIPELVRRFIDEFNRELGKNVRRLSDAALAQVVNYEWPGNVRELRNVIKSGLATASHDAVWLEDLPITLAMNTEDSRSRSGALTTLDEAERSHIEKVLIAVNWRKTEAARVLGITRATLDRKIAKHKFARPAKP